ncbi:hypothetical protein [Donghicola eburneus]|uniref:Putative secreted protein n=1 Tax=Donghicola eburneus TaxID=393278 RepID=A0A1M4N159_9RHOB|nr:hypothetical protein [Donghicola eburneus]SCM68612.1 putative secreted protein [Donghicola eburneus]SFQ28234.1 hypothetical protein SAMN05421764_102437 [Donghicola eburneus]
MQKLTTLALVSVTALAGCATPPSKIEPATVLPAAYADLDCRALEARRIEAAAKLADAEKRQREAVAADAAGVAIAFVPVSRLTGDAHEEVALHKGQVATIRQVQLSKSCIMRAPQG